ncbi:chondroitin sulfate N-acetylgalactosaminyltransferase 1-like [Patiria miniata]|uniref:Hexosyltransferase n=1 Tax=Patiria miniata TaxID=46514 RepID=A0A914A9Q2_PATMI|nr:chondroitin sulfate N-acetylgalactosaminyltransferase 1-like [Patiria miniata]XP_038060137.1 chondroitin sulfate N-acetylgalactosaminyltransferase 1-like [Patiria miniata]XP_038060138.1 chondroitin sulfate N-acetylgalactosaminyltransferase 1-like [Patiria miniata]XP_038060139.1 chondroitin sulfate N-acetylgalactosaminyltransferase 1-like [Patiria miniata]XP_038060140.1 chondroitin sulfate N-acetylgalactosaminyltransferase 1-like [Patiria miniata]
MSCEEQSVMANNHVQSQSSSYWPFCKMRLPSLQNCIKFGIIFCLGFLLLLANQDTCINTNNQQSAVPKPMEQVDQSLQVKSRDIQYHDDCIASLSEQEEKHSQEVASLKRQIRELKRELKKHLSNTQQVEEPQKYKDLEGGIRAQRSSDVDNHDDLSDFIRQQMAKIEMHKPLQSEYDVVPFSSLNSKLVYSLESGLSHRPSERPRGDKKEDLVEAVYFAIDILNKKKDNTFNSFSIDNFVDGIFKSERTIGTYYNLVFRGTQESYYQSVEILRPFSPLQKLRSQIIDTNKILVNIIIPLSGRLDKFQSFIERFKSVCLDNRMHVYLTVVYFGEEGLSEIHSVLFNMAHQYNFHNYKLIRLNVTFSRGRGLEEGVQNWDGSDVLMFFCDVDIAFTKEFIEHCRYNTVPGRTVYYPIVFSLYNPKIIHTINDAMPDTPQLMIHHEMGFWRDFGFGMTCQYRSDFLSIKGFNMDIKGWGGEDVDLYRRYIQSDLKIIRVTDPTIFHLYHPKVCQTNLTAEQYRMCIMSRAVNEASHSQLGILAFKDKVNMTLFHMGQIKHTWLGAIQPPQDKV